MTKGYRLYDVNREHILYSLSVVFEESKMGIGKEEISETEQSIELEECSSSSVEESNHPDLDVLKESNIDQIFMWSGSIQLRMLIESLLQ